MTTIPNLKNVGQHRTQTQDILDQSLRLAFQARKTPSIDAKMPDFFVLCCLFGFDLTLYTAAEPLFRELNIMQLSNLHLLALQCTTSYVYQAFMLQKLTFQK